MSNQESLFKINSTIMLSSNLSGCCKECSLHIGSLLDEVMNHYIQQHGYILLFIGSESDRDFNDYSLISTTVVILGKTISLSEFKTASPLVDEQPSEVESIG
ncbi:hypothetical protein [Legionella feeleii]|uniref:Uncharacterized protein n=1 Tax=Legionella feeleii TaxID=453 RepID=A0A378IPZ8_9GAMM|nr:hypothetical protein [Legionella feeleii]STX37306.1 Uncharacterised protein [Legionella feeleii]